MIFQMTKQLGFLMLACLGAMAAAPAARAMEVTPSQIMVSLIHPAGGAADASIRLTTKAAINGCPRVGPLRHTVTLEKHYFDVTIEGYTVDFGNLPRHPEYACKNTMQFATATIPLDRKTLRDNMIETVHFTVSNGRGQDDYMLSLDHDRISLVPVTGKTFKPALRPYGGQTALSLMVYPPQTLVLTAPGLPAAQRDDAVAAFARANHLTEMGAVVPGFVMPPGQENRRYYVDSTNSFAARLAAGGNTPVSDTVYARRPGAYE